MLRPLKNKTEYFCIKLIGSCYIQVQFVESQNRLNSVNLVAKFLEET